ncbi:MAG: hypothetical protein OEM52_05200 [bacterium]|nr:hypothetical protein [bacterium]
MNQSGKPVNKDDDQLRQQIRKRLEEQSQRLQKEIAALEDRETKILESERMRRILEEERDAYYTNLGYVKMINDDGAVEWLPPARAQALDDKVGEEIDDIEGGQRKVRWFAVGWIGGFIFLVFVLFLFFWPRPGSIRVVCNVPEAQIILDSDTTLFRTDAILEGVDPGQHIVSVYKSGYRIKGPIYQQVELKRAEDALMSFELELAPEIPMQATQRQTSISEPDTILERIRQRAAEIQARTASTAVNPVQP